MRVPEERRPPEGMMWRCQACGKEAEDRYGIVGWHTQGWDESCMLNAAPAPMSAMFSAAKASEGGAK